MLMFSIHRSLLKEKMNVDRRESFDESDDGLFSRNVSVLLVGTKRKKMEESEESFFVLSESIEIDHVHIC